ncbi:MAG: hypothetical protein ABI411_19615 [Tahibacter sp.]
MSTPRSATRHAYDDTIRTSGVSRLRLRKAPAIAAKRAPAVARFEQLTRLIERVGAGRSETFGSGIEWHRGGCLLCGVALLRGGDRGTIRILLELAVVPRVGLGHFRC